MSVLSNFQVCRSDPKYLRQQRLVSTLASMILDRSVRYQRDDRPASITELTQISWFSFSSEIADFSLGLHVDLNEPKRLLSFLRKLFRYGGIKFNGLITTSKEFEANFLKSFRSFDDIESPTSFLLSNPAQTLPEVEILPPSHIKIRVALTLYDCEREISNGNKLASPRVHLEAPDVKSSTQKHFSANLNLELGSSSLTLEERDMDNDIKIRTMIRLGTLEFALDEFLDLRTGSQIRFTLPEKTSVELELAGQVVGRGELRIEGDSFVLGLSEAQNGLR